MKKYWLSGLCVSLIWLSGCGVEENATLLQPAADGSSTSTTDADPASDQASIEGDSTEAAKSDSEFFVIDVRSAEEFATGNVDGAVNIPHTEILEGIKKVTDDKDARIYFY